MYISCCDVGMEVDTMNIVLISIQDLSAWYSGLERNVMRTITCQVDVVTSDVDQCMACVIVQRISL